jgi:hypothetical protein
MKPDWKQLTIFFSSPQALREEAWKMVAQIERVAKSDRLYFARYSAAVGGSKLVVKICTRCSCVYLKRRLLNVNVEAIEPGSTAHADAYLIAKAARTQKEPEKLLYDVVHWLMNMAGHSYSTEAIEYTKMTYGAIQNLRVALGEIEPPNSPARNGVPEKMTAKKSKKTKPKP